MPLWSRSIRYAVPRFCLTCMGAHGTEAEHAACRRSPRGTVQRVRVRELLRVLEAERRKP